MSTTDVARAFNMLLNVTNLFWTPFYIMNNILIHKMELTDRNHYNCLGSQWPL